MREIRKSEDSVDKCHAKRAKRQLASIGRAGDQNEIRQNDKGVENIRISAPGMPGALPGPPSAPRQCRYRRFVLHKNIAAVGDVQGLLGILLSHQNGDSGLGHLDDPVEKLIHHDR